MEDKNSLVIRRTTSDDKDFQMLVGQLNRYLNVQYGRLQDYYSQFNKIDNIPNVVLAYADGMPAGCGCFKKFDDISAEVKRMFVTDEQRGKGIGIAILQELEKWAAELGNSAMVLEHGNRQPEADRLYEKLGYAVIPNYGQYIGMETSICRMKELN